MINFEHILLFFLFLTIVCAMVIAKYIRYKHLLKLTKIYVMRLQQKTEVSFYSDIILKKCVKKLFFSFDKKKRKDLAELTFGKTCRAEKKLAEKNPILALFLKAHNDAKSAYCELKKNKKYWQENSVYSVLYAGLAEKFFDYEQAQTVIRKMNDKKLYGFVKAYYNKIAAAVYIRDADMLSASSAASFALKFFQKHDMPIEEAETYMLMGEIYRVSCVNDIAQTMLESALKIYQKFGLKLFEARALAVLGMLMVFENRFEEAEDKFEKSLQKAELPQITAEIFNQMALLQIAKKDYTKALKFAQKSLNLHEKQKNPRGTALSMQILAHLHSYKKHPHKAFECAQKAAGIYEKQKNFSALSECYYLQSTLLYKQNKLKMSEKILRKVLQLAESHKGSFHYANAYSLLGLIYLQKNDLQRAKVLIQQSLHLEQRNDRASGMAADYANLSLIESLNGDENSAAENLQIALEYAVKTEDEDLIKLIKERA